MIRRAAARAVTPARPAPEPSRPPRDEFSDSIASAVQRLLAGQVVTTPLPRTVSLLGSVEPPVTGDDGDGERDQEGVVELTNRRDASGVYPTVGGAPVRAARTLVVPMLGATAGDAAASSDATCSRDVASARGDEPVVTEAMFEPAPFTTFPPPSFELAAPRRDERPALTLPPPILGEAASPDEAAPVERAASEPGAKATSTRFTASDDDAKPTIAGSAARAILVATDATPDAPSSSPSMPSMPSMDAAPDARDVRTGPTSSRPSARASSRPSAPTGVAPSRARRAERDNRSKGRDRSDDGELRPRHAGAEPSGRCSHEHERARHAVSAAPAPIALPVTWLALAPPTERRASAPRLELALPGAQPDEVDIVPAGLHLTRTGEHTARVELDHPALGRLDVEVRAREGRVDVELLAGSLSSSIALRAGEESLRGDLRARGAELRGYRVRTVNGARARGPTLAETMDEDEETT